MGSSSKGREGRTISEDGKGGLTKLTFVRRGYINLFGYWSWRTFFFFFPCLGFILIPPHRISSIFGIPLFGLFRVNILLIQGIWIFLSLLLHISFHFVPLCYKSWVLIIHVYVFSIIPFMFIRPGVSPRFRKSNRIPPMYQCDSLEMLR